MIGKVIAVAVTAGMMQLLWPIEPLPQEEAPLALVTEVLSHQIVHMNTCDLPDLGLTDVECIATKDQQGRFWLITFDDEMKMDRVVLVDGAVAVLWCRADTCT